MANRPNRINIDLGPYKQPWVALCRAEGQLPSDLLRQIVAKLLQQHGKSPEVPPLGEERKIRKEISLTPTEAAHIAAAALAEGKSDAQWIVALVQIHMGLQPQLSTDEVLVLARSNLRLLSIGRNLNQLARTLNTSSADDATELVSVLQALRIQLTSHVDGVAAMVSSNLARWRS